MVDTSTPILPFAENSVKIINLIFEHDRITDGLTNKALYIYRFKKFTCHFQVGKNSELIHKHFASWPCPPLPHNYDKYLLSDPPPLCLYNTWRLPNNVLCLQKDWLLFFVENRPSTCKGLQVEKNSKNLKPTVRQPVNVSTVFDTFW